MVSHIIGNGCDKAAQRLTGGDQTNHGNRMIWPSHSNSRGSGRESHAYGDSVGCDDEGYEHHGFGNIVRGVAKVAAPMAKQVAGAALNNAASQGGMMGAAAKVAQGGLQGGAKGAMGAATGVAKQAAGNALNNAASQGGAMGAAAKVAQGGLQGGVQGAMGAAKQEAGAALNNAMGGGAPDSQPAADPAVAAAAPDEQQQGMKRGGSARYHRKGW